MVAQPRQSNATKRSSAPTNRHSAPARPQQPVGRSDRSRASRHWSPLRCGLRFAGRAGAGVAVCQTLARDDGCKSRGLGLCIGRSLRGSRPSDRSRSLVGGRQTGSCGLVFGSRGTICTSFGPRGVGTGALTASCGRGRYVRLLVWARADDVAKRRPQGLVVCRAASPFRGFFDARTGVTLAPTFAAWVACQSRTVLA